MCLRIKPSNEYQLPWGLISFRHGAEPFCNSVFRDVQTGLIFIINSTYLPVFRSPLGNCGIKIEMAPAMKYTLQFSCSYISLQGT